MPRRALYCTQRHGQSEPYQLRTTDEHPMTLDEYLFAHQSEFENDLCELLRLPRVRAASRHRVDIRCAADWVAGQFHKMIFKTEIVPTAGHPIVYAESLAAGT